MLITLVFILLSNMLMIYTIVVFCVTMKIGGDVPAVSDRMVLSDSSKRSK